MYSLPAAILLGLIGTLTATQAVAATPDDDAQVSFSSHQLATPAGRAAVIAKIVQTARRACIEPGFRPDSTTMACTRDVAAAMVSQAGDVQLALAWQGGAAGKTRGETLATARTDQTARLAAK